MLFRKMLREMRGNLGQFISIFILSFLAIFIYAGFEANVVGSGKAVKDFHEETNIADAWIYSEGFTEENLENVRDLDSVDKAQLRTEIRGTTPQFGGSQVDFYLMDESIILKPYLYDPEKAGKISEDGKSTWVNKLNEKENQPFDAEDEEGVWLNWSFANAWDISVGDEIELEHNGVVFSRIVRGLIMEPEYEYTKAEKDADTNFKNLAYVYMGYDAFPIREYVTKLINSEKITIDTIKEATEGDNEELNKLEDRLAEYGMTLDDVDKDMLLTMLDNMSDEDLMRLVPYTTMLVTFSEQAKENAAEKIKEEKSGLSEALYYEEALAEALDDNYAVMIDSSAVIGIDRVRSELEQHDTFSYTFAIIFLIVALLVISTTMSRLVEKQRTQIGTMNAIGMKRWKIALHYMSYSFFVALLGAALGLVAGPLLVGEMIVEMLMEWYMIPNVVAGFSYKFYIVAAVVVATCVLASFFSCRKLLKVPPAAALRPAAPRKARRILAERLPIWKKFSFSTQYNLRDVTRAPMRCIMGIVGTMVGTVLVIYAFGCYLLVDDIVEWNFDKLMNYDYQMVLTEDESADYFDGIAEDVDGELIMSDYIELAAKPHATALEKSKQSITVIEGKGLQNVTDEKTQVTSLTPGKVAITSRLAKKMGVGVGDKIYWHIYSKNDWYESEIGLINRTPETAGITMLREDLEATGCEYIPTSIVTKMDVMDYTYEEKDGKTSGVKGISAVYNIDEIKESFVEGYSVINYLFYMMMAFSIITVVVVLYNSGNLSFHERLKEFATLKVMGLSTGKIRRILNQENIWFAILGILLGIPLGKPSLIAMMNSNGDNFDYYVDVPVYLYILSAAFILIVAVLVSRMFSKKIKKLDMVETLKGME